MSTDTASMPTIDMHSISQLAENDEMGDQFVAEIITVFLADLSERVRTIGLQMNDGDRAGVAATAHAIKGSCGHFGATRLLELSHDLEDRARHEPTSDIQPALDAMIAETERVRAALEAFRRNQMPPN
jgi:HPt (histidine-containing phosphotransfer) domain-containing protein